MGSQEYIPEAYALEDFYFDGITNLFVAGNSFHVTFWTWQQTENGLLKFGIKRGVCPASNVNTCAFEAIATVAQAGFAKVAGPISSLLANAQNH